MENNKTSKVLGILSIAWGIVLLIYQILRNTVLGDWYSDLYMKELFANGAESAKQIKLVYEVFNSLLVIVFLGLLMIISALVVMYNKKRGIKIFSREEKSNGTTYILLGLLLYLLLGWNLISIIVVIIGGFLFCRQSPEFNISKD